MPGHTYKLVLLLFILSQTGLQAQSVNIYGIVQDSATQLPISNVKVSAGNGRYTTLTDAEGKYSLRIGSNIGSLQFSAEGFFTHIRPYTNAYLQEINVLLASRDRQLATVEVNSKRIRYSNRSNPAVELIKQVVPTVMRMTLAHMLPPVTASMKNCACIWMGFHAGYRIKAR